MSIHGEIFGCTMKNMDFQREVCRGMRSGFIFHCNMCNLQYTVWSEPENENVMNVNTAAVAAVMGTGGGYTTLHQIMAGMDVRCMSDKTYDHHHSKVSKAWEEVALDEMRAAAAEEAELARQRGDLDIHGVPLLTVVADCLNNNRQTY